MKNGKIYHVCSKSIANYVIFREDADYCRMKLALKFFRHRCAMSFSKYMLYRDKNYAVSEEYLKPLEKKFVDIIAYCIMPTHLHVILRQEKDCGISLYMNRVLNSYTKHFNAKHRRKGPLWESRFKKVPLEDRQQVLHMTRYLHLNPVLSFSASNPEQWRYSSYSEYLSGNKASTKEEKFCDISCLKIRPGEYKKFVKNNNSFHKQIALISRLILE